VITIMPKERPMQPLETIYIDDDTVGCDGGGGPLGHPLVYLPLTPTGQVSCPYCSRLYIQTEESKAAGGHGH
jgi:uncharacterized Zn-finger protein